MKIPFGNWSFILHKEGIRYVVAFGGVTFLLSMINSTIGVVGLFLTICCAAFFRDPARIVPNVKNVLVSPADGLVVDIKDSEIPSELSYKTTAKYKKISIFLSVFDVHVNKIPINSVVSEVKYHEGKFLNAGNDKASDDNERNSVVLELENDDKIVLVQIAGLIARRIVCDAKPGDKFNTGDNYGIIRFGSRVDMYIPEKYPVKIFKGQRMVGGETIMAELPTPKTK